MSTSPTSVQPLFRTAPAPFDKANADVILHTADGVAFRVFSQILMTASSFFQEILDAPQHLSPPTVRVTEDSKTIEILLRICYPINQAEVRTLEEVEPALRAAMKFEMELPITILTKRLEKLVSKSPVEVWAAACRLRLESVARRAAERLGRMKWEFKEGETLHGVNAGDYYRLREYLRLQRKVPPGYTFLDSSCPARAHAPAISSPTTESLLEAPHPDMICQSSDGVAFRVHKSALTLASPILREIVGHLKATATGELDMPVLRMEESSATLSNLLRLCYPSLSCDVVYPADPPAFMSLLASLEKYRMQCPLTSMRSAWQAVAAMDALRAYCVAVCAGKEDCAKQAARCALDQELEGVYVPEMEDIPALAYHRLLTYYDACRRVARDSLADVVKSLTVESSSALAGTSKPRALDSATRRPTVAGTILTSNEPVLEEVASTNDERGWVRLYVEELSDKVQSRPGWMGPAIGELFMKATNAEEGVWCSRCQTIATNLILVHEGMQNYRRALDEVSRRPHKTEDMELNLVDRHLPRSSSRCSVCEEH